MTRLNVAAVAETPKDAANFALSRRSATTFLSAFNAPEKSA